MIKIGKQDFINLIDIKKYKSKSKPYNLSEAINLIYLKADNSFQYFEKKASDRIFLNFIRR